MDAGELEEVQCVVPCFWLSSLNGRLFTRLTQAYPMSTECRIVPTYGHGPCFWFYGIYRVIMFFEPSLYIDPISTPMREITFLSRQYALVLDSH